ncbi:hypothetical protein Q1695_000677 [Nippostrongylus brasiliensis]|nr:hypothetical protein Q1695_000677 [Nippostrongylus brasiliensis]
MTVMQITLVLALLVGTCSCIPDSVGTSFIFGFIRDAQPTSQTQTLSATVLNGNTGSCVFTLAYRDDYDETKNPLKYSTTTVPSMSSAEVSIPSWYGWQYDSPGMQVESGPHQLLTANSTCPVTVIANNYDSTTGQGDSFLVLPTTWAKAGPVFAFTLPPSNNDATNPGYQHISIIPTVKDVSGTLTVMGSSSLPFKAKFGDQPTSYFAKKTPQNEPHTYHVQADGPILLVAGVTCAGNYQHCDHASYMPQPLPTSACTDKPSLYDDHAAYTRITNGYYIDVPSTCSTNQNVTVYGNRATTWQNTPVSVTQQMPLRVFGPSFGEAITIHAETAPVHVTRYYDQSKNNKQGAFIDIVASISQFITGNSTFYTRNENDMIEVVCDINVCPFATIDGTLLMAHDKNFTNTGPIMGINYYTFSVIVPKKGFHYFGSSNTGLYSYYVIGQATNAAYGYIGPINQAKVEPIVVTTPAPTTSSPTGPTTIPASSTSPVPIVTTTTKATTTTKPTTTTAPTTMTTTTTTITTTTATTTTTTRPTTHTTKPPTTTTTPTPHPTTTTPSKPPPTKPSPATTPSPKTTTTQPTVPQPNTTVTIPVVVTTPAKSSTAPPPNPTTPSTTPLAETTSVSTTTPSTSTQIGSDLSSNMLFSLVILLLTTYLMS